MNHIRAIIVGLLLHGVVGSVAGQTVIQYAITDTSSTGAGHNDLQLLSLA